MADTDEPDSDSDVALTALPPGTPDAAGTHVADITPDDVTTFSPPYRWLWIGGQGSVVVTMVDGSTATFVVPSDGTRLPIAVTQVKAATTATAILGVR
jgi:hypothetical protein